MEYKSYYQSRFKYYLIVGVLVLFAAWLFTSCVKPEPVKPEKRAGFLIAVMHSDINGNHSPIHISYEDSNFNKHDTACVVFSYKAQYKSGVVTVSAYAEDNSQIDISFATGPVNDIYKNSAEIIGNGKQTLTYIIP